jgi:hypothetical protein
MLQTISWKEYLLLMGGALVLYYGWWLVRYAASLGWGLPKRDARESDGRLAGLYRLHEEVRTQAKDDKTGPAGEGMKEAVPAVIVQPPSLWALAAALMKEVSGLLERALEEKMVEGELIFALQRLLSAYPHRQLRGTDFQEKISDVIVRELEKMGSIRLDAKVVNGLWDG